MISTQTKSAMKAALITGLLVASASTMAQQAGDFAVRLGMSSVDPSASNGRVTPEIVPGSGLDIKKANQVSGGITYFIDSNWAIDVPLAPAFKHDLVGTGTLAPAGKVGEVSNLPVQLLGQYRFGQAGDTIRPFVGLGATYVVVTSTRTTGALAPVSMDLDNSLGAAVQLGVAWAISPNVSLEAAAIKSSMTAKGRLSTGQSLSIKLKPTVLSVAAVYRF